MPAIFTKHTHKKTATNVKLDTLGITEHKWDKGNTELAHNLTSFYKKWEW